MMVQKAVGQVDTLYEGQLGMYGAGVGPGVVALVGAGADAGGGGGGVAHLARAWFQVQPGVVMHTGYTNEPHVWLAQPLVDEFNQQ